MIERNERQLWEDRLSCSSASPTVSMTLTLVWDWSVMDRNPMAVSRLFTRPETSNCSSIRYNQRDTPGQGFCWHCVIRVPLADFHSFPLTVKRGGRHTLCVCSRVSEWKATLIFSAQTKSQSLSSPSLTVGLYFQHHNSATPRWVADITAACSKIVAEYWIDSGKGTFNLHSRGWWKVWSLLGKYTKQWYLLLETST